jgi:uncharacterized protein (DUF885 family)
MSAVTAIADELYEAIYDRFPDSASLIGIPGRDDKLTDYGEAADKEFAAVLTDITGRAEALGVIGLSKTERLTRAVILQQTGVMLDRVQGRWIEFTVSDLILTTVPGLLIALATMPVDTAARGEDYLIRLGRLPAFFDTLAQRHRAGIDAGRLPVARLVRAAIEHLDNQIATADTLCRQPRHASTVSDVVVPAIEAYRAVLATEVLPHGRDDDHAGVCWLPGGDRLYATAVRGHTTTGRTPDELHRTGLEVIAELAAEYTDLGSRVFGTDDLQEIFARLRDDPDLRWRDGEEMLTVAKDTVGRAEAAAPQWFRTLPSAACVVAAYPASTSPNTPPAHLAGTLDGSRPGTYFVNPRNPAEKVRYEAEALAFHEGVPGHHLEVTLRQQRASLPMLRRTLSLSAYGEGWALYSERLADEMGLYSGDLARLGMLAMDSMRAGRLVVDTGLHAFGWSRRQAVEYLRLNTPMAPAVIESEVDRYLADPGQALAYMVGRLEIQRLRAKAEQALGAAFDLRDFHETVLAEGRLPLSALADLVTDWIGERT